MPAKIEVKQVSKIFGSKGSKVLETLGKTFDKQEVMQQTGHVVGVHDVSFTVETGEIFVIIGLSGSGKSTLIRCLNLLHRPTAGSIEIDGEDICEYSRDQLRELRRKKIAMVFQNFALLPHKNVIDNVAFGLRVRGETRQDSRKKALGMIEMVGLAGYENEPIQSLSGGMKQRVGLARALANDPEILLMDEAFSALDPIVRRDMQYELLNLQQKLQKTIVFITHDIQEAFKIGDRVAIMKDSKIVQVGTPEEILTAPANEYVERFITGVDKTQVLSVKSIMHLPGCLVQLRDGPKLALQEMRMNGVSSAFVMDQSLRFKGIVNLQDTLQAIKDKQPLESILVHDIVEVEPSTTVSDLVPLAQKSPYPIAVTENGRLLGIVTKSAILGSIA
ncbi:MAG: glycine betaine/L-proline ABC transporter ATP-binding protein [Clostridia bacterium]|nr:glycine betaine/L-proline ABC transporter ATP-binding protein [Clostridia bacterium]